MRLRHGEDIYTSVLRCIRRAAESLKDGEEIAAIAFTGQMAGFMGVGDHWEDITGWSCSLDTRYTPFADRQMAEFSEELDNHALAVHCGYFGLVARQFCTEWTLRPKALAIVDENAVVVDCRLPEGKATLAKVNANMKEITIIRAEIEDYVQYPGSDCLNGALIRYEDGHQVMENLASHHAIIMSGDYVPALTQMAKVFGFKTTIL